VHVCEITFSVDFLCWKFSYDVTIVDEVTKSWTIFHGVLGYSVKLKLYCIWRVTGDLMIPSTILKVQLSKYNIVISILMQKYWRKGIKIAKTKMPWGPLFLYRKEAKSVQNPIFRIYIYHFWHVWYIFGLDSIACYALWYVYMNISETLVWTGVKKGFKVVGKFQK
jgi:hypothetical protein